MVVATMSGIGQTAAMGVGSSNSQAFSTQDIMRQRLSQNIGNTADTQVQSIMSNQRIVVTLGAGTEMYLVFRKPVTIPEETALPMVVRPVGQNLATN